MDSWEAVKSSVVSLWRHSHPERIDTDLTEARSDLLQARKSGNGQELQGLLLAEWQARLTRLLASQPDLVDELRVLIQDQQRGAASAGHQPPISIALDAHVSGGGNVYQAGHNITVTKEGSA